MKNGGAEITNNLFLVLFYYAHHFLRLLFNIHIHIIKIDGGISIGGRGLCVSMYICNACNVCKYVHMYVMYVCTYVCM